MTVLLGLLALSCGPQDHQAVKRLIERLDDDSSQVREQATLRLAGSEPAILPLLRDAIPNASAEAKPRLLRAIRRIENRQVLGSKLQPARLITIDVNDQPLRQVLDGLGTPIELAGLTGQEKVSVSLTKVSFWEALQRICASRVGLSFEVSSGRVRVKNDPGQAPHRLSGPFAVILREAKVAKDGGEFSLSVQACWEEGIKPDGITLRFRELKDDQGTDLLGEDRDPFTGESRSRSERSCGVGLRSRTLPHVRASKLSRCSVRVGFEFTLRSVTATFKDATLGGGQRLATEEVSVRLDQFEERDGQVSGSLVIAVPEGRSVPSDLIQVVLKEESGKETRIGVGDLREGRLQVGFSAGGAPQKLGKLSELRVTLPTEVHTEAVDLALQDVPLER